MELFRKIKDSLVFKSVMVVFTLVSTILSLISFVYYATSTEYKYEAGYIIKTNKTLADIPNYKKVCSKFESFDSFKGLTDYSEGLKYIAIIQFCISTIATLIIQGYLFISDLREYKASVENKNVQGLETTEEAKNEKLKSFFTILKHAFTILLQPGTFVVTIINYDKPCVFLSLPEIFLTIALYTVLGFFFLIMCSCGIVSWKKGKQDNFFVIISFGIIFFYIIFSIVLFCASFAGPAFSIIISVINGSTFIFRVIDSIKCCSKSCFCC